VSIIILSACPDVFFSVFSLLAFEGEREEKSGSHESWNLRTCDYRLVTTGSPDLYCWLTGEVIENL